MLTEQEYVEKKGQICPFCGSNHVEAEIDKQWRDFYKLTGFEEL